MGTKRENWITKAEVFVICDAMDAVGQKPTCDSIRTALGIRGSFKTISAFLAEWLKQPPVLPGVGAPPDSASQCVKAFFARDIWPIAITEAQKVTDETLAGLHKNVATLSVQCETLVLAVEEVTKSRDSLSDRVEAQNVDLAALETERAVALQKNTELEAELKVLRAYFKKVAEAPRPARKRKKSGGGSAPPPQTKAA